MREQSLPIAGGHALCRERSRQRSREDERKKNVAHAAILLDDEPPVNVVRRKSVTCHKDRLHPRLYNQPA